MAEIDAITIYQNPQLYPALSVPEHAIRKVVEVLASGNHTLAAISLIRAAYRTPDGTFASLGTAVEIFRGITGRQL